MPSATFPGHFTPSPEKKVPTPAPVVEAAPKKSRSRKKKEDETKPVQKPLMGLPTLASHWDRIPFEDEKTSTTLQ
jgi:hypothetical protein